MQSMLSGVTSEIIQKYLEENGQLIMAILQNRNTGKEAECAMLEARLQRNLLYLAAVADCQGEMQATPQPPRNAATQLVPTPRNAATQLVPTPRNAATQLVPTPRRQFTMPQQQYRQNQQRMIPQSIMVPPSSLLQAQQQQQQQQQRMASHSRLTPTSGVNSPSNMRLGDRGQTQRSSCSRDRADRPTEEAEK